MSEPRLLVSVDPGVDRSAAAIWLPVAPSNDLETLATRLVAIRECHTSPQEPLAHRLDQLACWAALIVEDARRLLTIGNLVAIGTRARCVVEWPAYTGSYVGGRGHLKRADSLAKLYAATGAIVAGLTRWCPDVVLEPAAKVSRELKQDLGRRAVERAIAGASLTQHSPNNDDSRSAVYIGLCALAGNGSNV